MDAERELHAMLEASPLAEPVRAICAEVRDAGGRALLVGGWVRDALLGQEAKDIDVEVYGIAPDRLLKLLRKRFALDLVGRAFGVIKIRGIPIDVSLPRRESKTGTGHTGFEVLSDPDMTPEEAARRRDYTINAMAFHPLEGVLLDPFHGKEDLADRVLRHTSVQFVEDPLRVLRGMQFVARFELAAAPETVALCRTLEPEGLSRERIFDEWRKLVLQGTRPSVGLAFLRECGWIRYFPELHALIGCEQEPEWHPEGDVWIHTLHCMDAFAAERVGDDGEDLVVGLAVLCHDFGKPATTRFERGRLRSPGHDAAGEEPARTFLARLTNQQDLIEQVVSLVVHHLRPMQLYQAQPGDSAIRRLARNVRLDRLARVSRADSLGRPPLAGRVTPHGEWLLERAQALQVEASAPKPLLMGRHLLALGMQEGPEIGRILEACYEAQLNGEITTLDDALTLARSLADGG